MCLERSFQQANNGKQWREGMVMATMMMVLARVMIVMAILAIMDADGDEICSYS